MPLPKLSHTAKIQISFAASNYQGLITARVLIPLDETKLLQGKNIIDCIDPNALPIREDLV
jgi:hypothetical protein